MRIIRSIYVDENFTQIKFQSIILYFGYIIRIALINCTYRLFDEGYGRKKSTTGIFGEKS